ncbi:hypothetical protein ACSBPU_13000 [Parapusillimonas sp. JC17]|uniref:DUF1281 family ferredoxin-like fold protein n=1 Tax=Parapusillimonas sp. JC17 TaxID=3445768 RepID=UPI003FA01A23
MPNWVTVKIKSSPEVIGSMINPETSRIDFALMLPFPGDHDWDGIYGDAKQMAEIITGQPLSDHPLIATMQASNRAKARVSELSDESFEQFIGMLRNHRKCGYLHSMEFARDQWGTKWNACEPSHDITAGTAQFDTAWSCPEPLLIALSAKFPDQEIVVTYADEDIGSNCGTFTLLNGEKVESDEAPPWSQQSEADKSKWTRFACEVKGRDPSDYDDA